MRSLGLTGLTLLSLAGCAAAERPSLQALVERGQWVAACQHIDRVGTRVTDVRARREAMRRVGAPYRTSVVIVPETVAQANGRLELEVLHGDIASLRVTAVSTGPNVESTHLIVTARHDGTLWRSLGTHRADHDLLARLFGRESPASSEDSTSTSAPDRPSGGFDSYAAAKRFQTAVERCQASANPCEQWFPLARVAPSLGPEEMILDLDLWLEGATGKCLLETQRRVPLPAGDTLHDKLVALAARGPIEVGWGE